MRPFRAAFTLMEMLVVIGIMMVLLGLTIGAVSHTPKVNALVATEHMVADVIRQARHTARSSGAPVMIEIRKNEREIMGVSQIMLYNDSFEPQPSKLAVRTGAIDPLLSVVGGLTGRGITVGGFILGNSALETMTAPAQQQKDLQLFRTSSGGKVEGFYLACAVNASGLAARIPLVQVGSDAQSTSTCGIALRTITRQIQLAPGATMANPTPPPATINKPDQKPEFTCLDPFGWIQDDSGTISYVSADVDAPTGAQAAIDSSVSDKDVTGPMMPGSWQEIGLMFDGKYLELYRNGILVGQKNVSVAKLKSADNAVYLGRGLFTDPLTPSPLPAAVYVVGALDDVRLQRLGVDRAGLLPSGIQPASDYTFSVHPDGRVTSAGVTKLRFDSVSGGDFTEVTIAVDGMVTSATTMGP
jgi:hypothetical protein